MASIKSAVRRLSTWARLAPHGRKGAFDKIYRENFWGSPESVSGPGSVMEQTGNIRRELPRIYAERNIRRVFDAPCGDFNWMRHVVADHPEVAYTGGDIVEGVLDVARSKAADLPATFVLHDIVEDPLPDVDLWICRDCLFHLSYQAIRGALTRFAESNVPYALFTTHKDPPVANRNIVNGDFRILDLFAEPINLPRDVLDAFDDVGAPWMPTRMILVSREQVVKALG